ncbi:hypothetical protein [Actinacidiphila glaucinigra]|uniref:hypothetical protein n=1 Tax=Actinacidiphila glaucinigra TaxID=235986 RepID=UPI002E33E057|nr:hypothetical protein [Actinacidiphila glaucinigra]
MIEAEIHSRTTDGGDFGGAYRLLTTFNDHRTDPADHLVRLYHERWEIEITYLALRHTLLKIGSQATIGRRLVVSPCCYESFAVCPHRGTRTTRSRRPIIGVATNYRVGVAPTEVRMMGV